jgi:hypothetical protein
LDESLKIIQEYVSKVRLYRFEEAVRRVVTDGLRAKVLRITAGAGNLVPRPAFYSIFPFMVIFAFKSSPSSGQDKCCDFSDLCSAAIQQELSRRLTQTVATSVQQGAVGAVAGTAGSLILTQIASRIGGSATPTGVGEQPVEPATPTETPQPPPKLSEFPPPAHPEITSRPPLTPQQQETLRTCRQIHERNKQDDAHAENERRRRGITHEQENEELMKDRPACLQRLDHDLPPYMRRAYPAWSERPRSIRLPTQDEMKLEGLEKQQYDEWQRKRLSWERRYDRATKHYGPMTRHDAETVSSVTGPRT